jgi:hypothetical protein
MLRDGLPPLRHALHRVLPERTAGEPLHRHAACLHGARHPGLGAHGQHEERGRQEGCRRQSRLAEGLRGVHGLHRLPDEALQAKASMDEGQGRAPHTVREGELPPGQGVHRHNPAQRGGEAVVPGAVGKMAPRGGVRARRRAQGRMHAACAPVLLHGGGGALALPEEEDILRRVRELRGQALRRAPLVCAQGMPRGARRPRAPHIQRRPLAGAGRASGHMGPARQLLRRAVDGRRRPGRAADAAAGADGQAGCGTGGRSRLRESGFGRRA